MNFSKFGCTASIRTASPADTCFRYRHLRVIQICLRHSCLHSFCVNMIIFTSETYTNMISAYSWSRHTILAVRKITSDRPKIEILTLFTKLPSELRMQMAAASADSYLLPRLMTSSYIRQLLV